MGERKPGISAGEGWIELDSALEIPLRPFVIGSSEPIHVPEAAMMRLPCVQRIRRPEHCATTLGGFYFSVQRTDDLRPDGTKDVKSVRKSPSRRGGRRLSRKVRC